MAKTRQPVVGKNKVSMRVLFAEADYQALTKLAAKERTDIGSLVRRAVVLQYALPPNENIGDIPEDTAVPANIQPS